MFLTFFTSCSPSGCAFWTGWTLKSRLVFGLLCLLILPVSGCTSWEGQTGETALEAPPATPGAVVTNDWSYVNGGEVMEERGEWIHLPAGEAGNLLLWMKQVEEKCR